MSTGQYPKTKQTPEEVKAALEADERTIHNPDTKEILPYDERPNRNITLTKKKEERAT